MKQILLTNIFHIVFISLLTMKILDCNITWLGVFTPLIIELSMVFGYLAAEYNQKKGNK